MAFISIFDVLGPEMIGPSSSHTAGACSIALLAGKMADSPITHVEFTLYQSFAKPARAMERTWRFWEESWAFPLTTKEFPLRFP